MPYISKKEEETLLNLEELVFHFINFKRESFDSVDDFVSTYALYLDLWKINERLQKNRAEENQKSKAGMRKFRSENPEKAKQYAREYMREYNRRKKEAKGD